MRAQPQPLIEVFAAIPDLRCGQGKRHPLPAILSLACCAMVCGYRRESASAAWGRHAGTRMAQALGFTHHTPCAATLHTVFRHGDRDDVAGKWGAWAAGVVGSTPAAPAAGEAAVARDGNMLRGSRQHGAPGVHLWSALAHHGGLTLAQQAVDEKSHAITHVETVLRPRVLQGRGLTMDALLTQRHVAQTMVDAAGDDVMMVKDQQPQLRADIALVLT
jgi:DDE_Tnp_1-associated